jgi:hypothetical protein
MSPVVVGSTVAPRTAVRTEDIWPAVVSSYFEKKSSNIVMNTISTDDNTCCYPSSIGKKRRWSFYGDISDLCSQPKNRTKPDCLIMKNLMVVSPVDSTKEESET